MAKKFNSVPGGQIGSGAAQVFGDSNALNNLMETIDYNRKMGLLNVNAKKMADAQINKDFADHQLKAKSGILFQDELNAGAKDWMDIGSKYRSQGFNPFSPDPNDPAQIQASNDFLRKKADIEGMADTRDVYQKNFLAQQALHEKGGYDEDSWVALNDFYKNNKLKDLYTNGVPPPSLTKSLDKAAFVKGIPVATQETNTINNGIETRQKIVDAPKLIQNVKSYIDQNKVAKRTYYKEFNIDEAKMPLGMAVGVADAKQLTPLIDQYYRTSKEGVDELAKEFAGSGEIPSYNSPRYQKFLSEKTTQQADQEARYDKMITTVAGQASGDEDTFKRQSFNYAQENQRDRRLAAQQRNVKFAERNDHKKEEQQTFWHDKANDIIDGVDGSGEFLFDAIRSNADKLNHNVDGTIHVVSNNDGSTTIKLPKITKNTFDGTVNGKDTYKKTVVKEAKDFTFNPKNKDEAMRRVTDMLNIYTGEKEKYSKQFTPEGKGKVPVKQNITTKFIGVPKGGF
jgi:hypothetical protein